MTAAFVIWPSLLVAFAANALLHPEPKLVFLIFSNASRNWWTDSSIYAAYEGLDVYRYSPTFAVLLTPFAVFPDRVAVLLWNVLSIGVLFGSLRVLVREILPGSWSSWHAGLLLVLSIVGTVRGVWSGQTNALLTGFAILAVAAVLKRRWWIAAFLLAGPVFIKIWPIALFLLLAVRWPRQLIGRFAAASTVLAVVPFLTRAPTRVIEEYVSFYETLVRTAPMRWRGYRDGWTILEQFGPVNELFYTGLQFVTVGLVLAWCMWQGRRGLPTRHFATLILAIWVGWQLLLGPGTERLTYGLIAPFATWAMLRSYHESRFRVLTTLAWLMTGILGSGAAERALLPFFPWAPAILPLGVILYLLWLMVRETGKVELSRADSVAGEP